MSPVFLPDVSIECSTANLYFRFILTVKCSSEPGLSCNALQPNACLSKAWKLVCIQSAAVECSLSYLSNTLLVRDKGNNFTII